MRGEEKDAGDGGEAFDSGVYTDVGATKERTAESGYQFDLGQDVVAL